MLIDNKIQFDKGLLDIEKKPEWYYEIDRSEMLKFIPAGSKKILEVGCGSGNFGLLLKSKLNAEVWGVEISSKPAKEAMAKLDKVIVADFEDDGLILPEGYFDCVVFNDALEHMKYPWNVLQKTKACLTKNGYIVLSIPNVRYLDNLKDLILNKDWRYVNAGILDKTHLRFFTEKSIRDLAELCGYKVVIMEGVHPKEFYWKFKVINWFMKNKFSDMKFLHFACVIQKK